MSDGFTRRLIRDDGARTTDRGLSLQIRLPWYRALPVSTVEISSSRLGVHAVALETIELEINGNKLAACRLEDRIDDWWYVLDYATLHVAGAAARPGAHTIELTVVLYPPYIPGLKWVTTSSKSVMVA